MFKEIITWLFGTGRIINGLLFIPQATKNLDHQTAKGVFIPTVAGFNALQVIGLVHGFINNVPELMPGMIVSLVRRGVVTACVRSGVCEMVNLWGMMDQNSWYEFATGELEAEACVFDDDGTPKLAFFTILRGFMEGY